MTYPAGNRVQALSSSGGGPSTTRSGLRSWLRPIQFIQDLFHRVDQALPDSQVRLQREISVVAGDLKCLIQLIENREKEAVAKERKTNTELIQTSSSQAALYTKKKEEEDRLAGSQSKLETLKSALEKQRLGEGRLSKKMGHLQENIEVEEVKRSDALLDSIPIVGIFTAVIGGIVTKRYERFIPLHSTVTGLYSLISKKKEEYEKTLEEVQAESRSIQATIASLKRDVLSQQGAINGLKPQIDRLQQKIDQMDMTIKELGAKLTKLRGWLRKLRNLHNLGDLLSKMVEERLSLSPEERLSREDVDKFLGEVEKLKQELLASP